MPMVLDRVKQTMEAEASMQLDVAEVLDVTFMADQPAQFREGSGVLTQLNGCFQALYYDMDGQLQCKTENWSGEWDLPMDEDAEAQILLCSMGQGNHSIAGDGIRVTATANLEAVSVSSRGLPMTVGLNMGDQKAKNSDRPSLILRRPGECSLWELAKTCGSTMEAICKVNQLSAEPESEQMLLIPVL